MAANGAWSDMRDGNGRAAPLVVDSTNSPWKGLFASSQRDWGSPLKVLEGPPDPRDANTAWPARKIHFPHLPKSKHDSPRDGVPRSVWQSVATPIDKQPRRPESKNPDGPNQPWGSVPFGWQPAFTKTLPEGWQPASTKSLPEGWQAASTKSLPESVSTSIDKQPRRPESTNSAEGYEFAVKGSNQLWGPFGWQPASTLPAPQMVAPPRKASPIDANVRTDTISPPTSFHNKAYHTWHTVQDGAMKWNQLRLEGETKGSMSIDVAPVRPARRSEVHLNENVIGAPGGPLMLHPTGAGRVAAAQAAQKAHDLIKKHKGTQSAPSLHGKRASKYGYAIRSKSLISSLKDLRRAPLRALQEACNRVDVPDGIMKPLPGIPLPKEMTQMSTQSAFEIGETLTTKILEETADTEDSLTKVIASLQESQDVCDEHGGARHATICVSLRARTAAEKKRSMLESLASAQEEFHETGDVVKFRKLLYRTLHDDVPTHPHHGLHPEHHRAEVARNAIAKYLEERAQAVLAFSNSGTDSCDGIEDMIKDCISIGIEKSHPALAKSQQIANNLREAERLRQRAEKQAKRQAELRAKQQQGA